MESKLQLSVITTESIQLVEDFHAAFDESFTDRPCVPDLNRHTSAELQNLANGLYSIERQTKRDIAHYATPPVCLHRARLMIGELAELISALASGNMTEVLKESADNRYVHDGTIVACGLAPVFAEGFRRVHESNMSKQINGKFEKDEHGKVVKGDNYKPCRLDDLIK